MDVGRAARLGVRIPSLLTGSDIEVDEPLFATPSNLRGNIQRGKNILSGLEVLSERSSVSDDESRERRYKNRGGANI